LQLLDTLSPRKDLKRAAQQTRIGNHFGQDVYERADAAANQDDPKPVGLGATSDEVHDGNRLQNDTIRKEEPEHAARDYNILVPTVVRANRIWTSGSARATNVGDDSDTI
jgi:hypothetical protein